MDSDGPPAFLRWTWQGRILVFALSATSIWYLLAEFYGLCSMQTFTVAVLLPATVTLTAHLIFGVVLGLAAKRWAD
jgi:hypothetical protein